MFYLNIQSPKREIVLANAHYYQNETSPLYLNRTLKYHDLIYMVDGSWTFTEDNQDYTLQKNDILLLSANHHHYTRLPCSPGTRTFCIHVSNEPGDSEDHPGVLSVSKQLNAEKAPSIRKTFEKIVAAFWSNDIHKGERMTALFQLMMLDIAEISTAVEHSSSNILGSINHFISQNAYKRLTASDIAEQFSLSPKMVENLILSQAGMSFAKYQTHLKLEMVASFLDVETDIRLSEVANLYGFCDEFHLSHAFKRQYGVSPIQYKKRTQK